jgi:hypothetical protein
LTCGITKQKATKLTKTKNLIFNLLLITTMKTYIDLTNTATYEAVATTLIEYGYNEETIDFAFSIY